MIGNCQLITQAARCPYGRPTACRCQVCAPMGRVDMWERRYVAETTPVEVPLTLPEPTPFDAPSYPRAKPPRPPRPPRQAPRATPWVASRRAFAATREPRGDSFKRERD